ncbi:hypothetical protein FGL98_24855 [Leekyejoonella antrihumi]|uniref:CN hydrolase domain-containing protein n=1 Tax=Leekyejoonella antrihumi TaxID=1660198 RepID=A0A563DP71_9MICO|nr:hypothetical protein FGL98_24855 [Leekyejoonella antrihumi]
MVGGGQTQVTRVDVALFQIAYGDDESLADRVGRVCEWIREVERPDLIVLPELWAHGGFASSSWTSTAELLDGATVAQLSSVARKMHTWIHAGSIIEKADEGSARGPEDRGLWNTSALLSPEGHVHRARHDASTPGRDARRPAHRGRDRQQAAPPSPRRPTATDRADHPGGAGMSPADRTAGLRAARAKGQSRQTPTRPRRD